MNKYSDKSNKLENLHSSFYVCAYSKRVKKEKEKDNIFNIIIMLLSFTF